MRILDSRGGLVAEQMVPATSARDVRLQPGVLSKGVYTCQVIAGNEQRSVRFVKL